MKIIGIDIDGVLTDVEKFELKYGEKFFGYSAPNPNGYEVDEKFNVPVAWANIFWKEYILKYAEELRARRDAALVTNQLHKDGYKIVIITARKYESHYSDIMEKDEMPIIVKEWLKDNNIYYDKIFFTGECKVEEVKSNHLSFMIEDSPKNISELSEYVPVIAFNAECNKDIKGNNIVHANTWWEVYKIITGKKLY